MGGSSPSPEQLEVAEALLRRARSDLRACRRLASDRAMDDDVVGFHAQQTVEKSIKAVLVLNGIDFPRTHDLDFLVARAKGQGLDAPSAVANAGWLSPWAAQLRYDESSSGLDRALAVETGAAAIDWAQSVLGSL
jgi:HEPN domain-containing protein